tara:strand:- start:985 stop:1509 length:525 start_codon:yes stop_codon:yes gene_type:complete
MKNFLKLILIAMSLFSFNKNAFSCDALNISIGEDFSKASKVIDVIEEYVKEDYEEYVTVEYEDNTMYYCPDIGLDNTILKVFIYESKLAGIRLETWDPSIEKNKIYEYAKTVYGNLEAEVKGDNWTGHKDISSGGKKIFYSKYKEIDGTYETLDISNEELIRFTVGEDIVQANY